MAWTGHRRGGDQRQALHLAFWSRPTGEAMQFLRAQKVGMFFKHITIYPQQEWYRPLRGGGPPNTEPYICICTPGMCSK